ncbi:hypothetical protein UlMin_026947 [Ulmus minor]
MALTDEIQTLTKAFTGLGVDERSLVTILGKWKPEERQSFRKGNPNFFKEDERHFERCHEDYVKRLEQEFMRFKKAIVLWTMHPWERDARMAKKAIKKGPEAYAVLVEIACSRSSEELLGARRAYHSLFEHSIEEDTSRYIKGSERKLLVALVSAYRYEGSKVEEDHAKSEAKALANAIKNSDKKKLLEDDEVVRILATRSKPHIQAVYKQYKQISDKNLDEDLEVALILKETVQCLCSPEKYYTKVLDEALKNGTNQKIRKALTRVIVTQADADMKNIREEFQTKYGVALSKKIEDTACGSYKDFLVNLVARGN